MGGDPGGNFCWIHPIHWISVIFFFKPAREIARLTSRCSPYATIYTRMHLKLQLERIVDIGLSIVSSHKSIQY
jgi:hypothetical protein